MPGYLVKTANFVAEIANDEELKHLAEVDTIKKNTQICAKPGKNWVEAKEIPILRKLWGLETSHTVPPISDFAKKPAGPPRFETVIDYRPEFAQMMMHAAENDRNTHDAKKQGGDPVLPIVTSKEIPAPQGYCAVASSVVDAVPDMDSANDADKCNANHSESADDDEDLANPTLREPMFSLEECSDSAQELDDISGIMMEADASDDAVKPPSRPSLLNSAQNLPESKNTEPKNQRTHADHQTSACDIVQKQLNTAADSSPSNSSVINKAINASSVFQTISLVEDDRENNTLDDGMIELEPDKSAILDIQSQLLAKISQADRKHGKSDQNIAEIQEISNDSIASNDEYIQTLNMALKPNVPKHSVPNAEENQTPDAKIPAAQNAEGKQASDTKNPAAQNAEENQTSEAKIPAAQNAEEKQTSDAKIPAAQNAEEKQTLTAAELDDKSTQATVDEVFKRIHKLSAKTEVPDAAPDEVTRVINANESSELDRHRQHCSGVWADDNLTASSPASPRSSLRSCDESPRFSDDFANEPFPSIEISLSSPSLSFPNIKSSQAAPSQLNPVREPAARHTLLGLSSIVRDQTSDNECADAPQRQQKTENLCAILADPLDESDETQNLSAALAMSIHEIDDSSDNISRIDSSGKPDSSIARDASSQTLSASHETRIVAADEAERPWKELKQTQSDDRQHPSPKTDNFPAEETKVVPSLQSKASLNSIKSHHQSNAASPGRQDEIQSAKRKAIGSHAKSAAAKSASPAASPAAVATVATIEELRAARAAVEAAQNAIRENGELSSTILKHAASLVSALEKACILQNEQNAAADDDETRVDYGQAKKNFLHNDAAYAKAAASFEAVSDSMLDESPSERFQIQSRESLKKLIEEEENYERVKVNEAAFKAPVQDDDEISRSEQFRVRGGAELRQMLIDGIPKEQSEQSKDAEFCRKVDALKESIEKEKEEDLKRKKLRDELASSEAETNVKKKPSGHNYSVTDDMPLLNRNVIINETKTDPKRNEPTIITSLSRISGMKMPESLDDPFFDGKLEADEISIAKFDCMFLTNRRLFIILGGKTVSTYETYDVQNVQWVALKDQADWVTLVIGFLCIAAAAVGLFVIKPAFWLSIAIFVIWAVCIISITLLLFFKKTIQIGMPNGLIVKGTANITNKNRGEAMEFLNHIDAARISRQRDQGSL